MQWLADRLPLISQRGNFSGKASAKVEAEIEGEWWRSDPSTGEVPEYVDRNAQWDINQGPVDASIKNAKETISPTTLTYSAGYRPKEKSNQYLEWTTTENRPGWREIFVWHPFTKKVEEPVEFSVMPTKF